MNFKESILNEFPDIFEGLTEEQTHMIINSAASHWLDGFEPTRETLQNAADILQGKTTSREIIDRLKENHIRNAKQ